MKLLIFGKYGQLSEELQRAVPASWDVIALSSSECDVTDHKAVMQQIEFVRPDAVINCAAYTAVDRAEDERSKADAVNWLAVENMARVAARNDVTLIHISTDYVFDGTKHKPYNENDSTAPINYYGASKLRGEKAFRESGCRGVIIRVQWLYSPYGKNFMRTMLRIAEQQAEVRVVADQYGAPTAADDLAAMIVKILPEVVADRELRGEIFHFASAGRATWSDFAEEIFRVAEGGCRIIPITTAEYPTAAKRPANSLFDCSKICHRFGIQLPDWREAVKRNIKKL